MPSHFSPVTSPIFMRSTSDPALFTRISIGPSSSAALFTSRANLVFLAHVGPDGNRLPACAGDARPRLFGAFLVVEVADGHLGSQFGEYRRRGRADARRCSRNQRDFTRQIQIVPHVSLHTI